MKKGSVPENYGLGDDWSSIAPWLSDVFSQAGQTNNVLRKNGAVQAADAREALIMEVVAAANAYAAECVTVQEAAQITGVNEETVRRSVRRGQVGVVRQSSRGKMRIPRRDLNKLPSARRPRTDGQSYNVEADAQRLVLFRAMNNG